MERNHRKVFTGEVVSTNMDKTITVSVLRAKKHRLYNKAIKYTKKYACHDENNEAAIGDIVKVMSTRPLSKNKRFRMVQVVKHKVII